MLRLLNKPRRVVMAAAFAVFYAVCALAPTSVLAFAGAPGAAHGLGVHDHARAFAQVHKTGATTDMAHKIKSSAHDHAGHGHAAFGGHGDSDKTTPEGSHAPPAGCCGIFCISALAPSFELTALCIPLLAKLEPPVTGFMSGQHPSRIDRPPRSLPSI